VSHARLRLVSLCVSLAARQSADWYLLTSANHSPKSAVAIPMWLLGSIVLAPAVGVASNAFPRRRLLIVSAAYSLLAFYVCGALSQPLQIYSVAVVGSALFSAALYAQLPAAAVDCRWWLPRICALVEIFSVGGALLGYGLGTWRFDGPSIVELAALNTLCLVAALPAAFPSDKIRSESAHRVAIGLLVDYARVLRNHDARSSLLGLALTLAVVVAGISCMQSQALGDEGLVTAHVYRTALIHVAQLAGVGVAVGCMAAVLQAHPRRCLGLVPVGLTILLVGLVWTALSGNGSTVSCVLVGSAVGLVCVPLRATYLAAVPDEARGNAAAFMNAVILAVFAVLSHGALRLVEAGLLSASASRLAMLATLTAAGTGVAWFFLYPQAMEAAVEIGLVPIYRIRAHGPGAGRLPLRGPLLLVANHSAYLDPFWIAKVVPRQVRPMMTSAFYDLPVVRWLSRHVARAIRVPTGVFRREAPELQEAIDALGAGECVVIFPEGMLRRSEAEFLQPFGRGVWQILAALPETPVSFCWIEGGWGSYYSYKDGPPGKNKQADRGHAIDIAFSEPRPLDPAVLADHHTARKKLRQMLAESRDYLRLPIPCLNDRTGSTEEHAGEPLPES
jgi:1-acyl-sn-glycerol-3-phosphate acyltransferase